MAATPVLSQARMNLTVHAPAAEVGHVPNCHSTLKFGVQRFVSGGRVCVQHMCFVCVGGGVGGVASLVAVLPGLADGTPPPHTHTAPPRPLMWACRWWGHCCTRACAAVCSVYDPCVGVHAACCVALLS